MRFRRSDEGLYLPRGEGADLGYRAVLFEGQFTGREIGPMDTARRRERFEKLTVGLKNLVGVAKSIGIKTFTCDGNQGHNLFSVQRQRCLDNLAISTRVRAIEL